MSTQSMKERQKLAPAGAAAFSPRQAAKPRRRGMPSSPKHAVALAGARADFAPTGAKADLGGDGVPRPRGCRRLPWAKGSGHCQGHPHSVKLTLINQTGRRIKHRWLVGHLRTLLKLLKITRGQWAITVINDKAMRALHKRMMNDPTPTDVITFDMRDDVSIKNHIDLDTVVCRDVAAENAKEYGHSVNDELLLYAVHSLLHVRGYDDRTAAESARMHRREDALLIRLGVGAIYKGKNRL